jgi:hypothetical protein
MRLSKRTVIISVIALSGAVLALGYFGGHVTGGDAMERINLLWRYGDLPKADQELLARASIECGLNRVPLEAGAIEQCLREGAAKLEHRRVERQYSALPSNAWSVPMEQLLRRDHAARKG